MGGGYNTNVYQTACCDSYSYLKVQKVKRNWNDVMSIALGPNGKLEGEKLQGCYLEMEIYWTKLLSL